MVPTASTKIQKAWNLNGTQLRDGTRYRASTVSKMEKYLCWRGHRSTSAMTNGLVVKYNDWLIFSLITNWVVFCKVKINYHQYSPEIWLFWLPWNIKGLVLVHWHTLLMIFEFPLAFGFCFPVNTLMLFDEEVSLYSPCNFDSSLWVSSTF